MVCTWLPCRSWKRSSVSIHPSDKARRGISIWLCNLVEKKKSPLNSTCPSTGKSFFPWPSCCWLFWNSEEIAKYDRLKKNYEDPTFEVVSSVFRALAKKKIIGAGSFQRWALFSFLFLNLNQVTVSHLDFFFYNYSRDGYPGIKANLKAVQGDLFLLEKYIFFVSKSPLLVEISDIHQIVFSRVGAGLGATAGRTFDLKIITKSGPEHYFTSVNKEEHESVDAYLKDKKVKIKTENVPDVEMMLAVGAGDDDEDDEDDEIRSVDSGGDHQRKTNKPSQRDDDDDSEEDGTCLSRNLTFFGF